MAPAVRVPRSYRGRSSPTARHSERGYWERAGVFTLATRFGDDGTKLGEFEELLRQVDHELLGKAMTETGGSKPRAGAYFAAAHPELPDPLRDLFQKIAEYLHLM